MSTGSSLVCTSTLMVAFISPAFSILVATFAAWSLFSLTPSAPDSTRSGGDPSESSPSSFTLLPSMSPRGPVGVVLSFSRARFWLRVWRTASSDMAALTLGRQRTISYNLPTYSKKTYHIGAKGLQGNLELLSTVDVLHLWAYRKKRSNWNIFCICFIILYPRSLLYTTGQVPLRNLSTCKLASLWPMKACTHYGAGNKSWLDILWNKSLTKRICTNMETCVFKDCNSLSYKECMITHTHHDLAFLNSESWLKVIVVQHDIMTAPHYPIPRFTK